MTDAQEKIARFKNNDANRSQLKKLLNDPVMVEAFDVLRATFEGFDVIADAPEVASVRTLSMRAGFDSFPIKLRDLTEVPITAQAPLKETWDEK